MEETGLNFEPTTLLSVEVARGHWFRFTFTGNINGKLDGAALKVVASALCECHQVTG